MIIDMPTVSMGNSGSILPAEQVSYDNTSSGLEAANVQDAVDEVNSNLEVEDITEEFRNSVTIESGIIDTLMATKVGNIINLTVESHYQSDTEYGNDALVFNFSKFKPSQNCRNCGFSQKLITGIWVSINSTLPRVGIRGLYAYGASKNTSGQMVSCCISYAMKDN